MPIPPDNRVPGDDHHVDDHNDIADELTALAGGAGTVGGDLTGTGGAAQVTVTHLASPLPLAQGGTGQATQQAAIDALTGTQTSGNVRPVRRHPHHPDRHPGRRRPHPEPEHDGDRESTQISSASPPPDRHLDQACGRADRVRLRPSGGPGGGSGASNSANATAISGGPAPAPR